MRSNSAPTGRCRLGSVLLRVLPLLVLLLVSLGLLSQNAQAAFAETTTSPTTNWSSGAVALTDDDSDSALFAGTTLTPGDTDATCITVTSSGDEASAVRLYGTDFTSSKGLAAHLRLTIEHGSGNTFAGRCDDFRPAEHDATLYDGTLAAFGTGAAAKTDFATGVGDWAPTAAAEQTQVYRFTYTLSAAAPNHTQGGTASIGFTWEAQNG